MPPRLLVPLAAGLLAAALAGCDGGGGDEGGARPGGARDARQERGAGEDCGVGEFAGAEARTFCGDAAATVEVGGERYEFAGGTCEAGEGYLVVNVGTVVLGTLPADAEKPGYFGIVAGDLSEAPGGDLLGGAGAPIERGRPYRGEAVVTYVSGTVTESLEDTTIRVARGGRRGTFEGTGFFDGAAVTGSFDCG